MSLAAASAQWFPTSVQVTVHQARNLRAKGKNGTNDAYAIMQVAKDKFSTTVSEKSVEPVWKEEASFDLPLFHPGNGDRCTLYVIAMHRAHVGLDKFLGQAVVHLLDLHEDHARKKTAWFKLVDKSGKQDKERGEVLLDIQFMRNNMSASMLDLSMQDKPRSRISKLKDKVRGKKKDGFSDSASAIVPSSTVLTDSEGEADTQSLNQSGGVKKKSKLKTLFAPKSNLQRNVSQSMSTLGTLPEKNSSLSGSRSSGLNADSPDVKKKFKFLGHKRTGSSDSKQSLGTFSLLGRSKQSNSDQNNMCVNGAHVYAEETDPHSGSTLSLNSSGKGSVEDVRKQVSVDPFVSAPVPSNRRGSTGRAALEQQRHQEQQEEEKRQAEERSTAEAKRLQEEEERRQQVEQERKRRSLEDELRRKKQKEEEEEEPPTATPRINPGDPDKPISTPFEDIHIGIDNGRPADYQKSSSNQQPPSATHFLNRTAKVSAVKPRYAPSLESDPADCQTPPSQPCPSPATSESTLSSVPSQSPDTFSSLHSYLSPKNLSQSLSGSPRGSVEDLSPGLEQSSLMADKQRRAPVPQLYRAHGAQNARKPASVGEIVNPSYVERDEPGRNMSLPLPDYNTLFPQKRHGVQGHTRWDHIIAEVNQKHSDFSEMNVDGPEEDELRVTVPLPQESAAMRHYQTQSQPTKPVSPKKVAAPTPPKLVAPPDPQSVADSIQTHSQNTAEQSFTRPNLPAASAPVSTSRESLPPISRDAPRRALLPSAGAMRSPRSASQMDSGTATPGDEREVKVSVDKKAPTAKARQRASGKEPVQQEDWAVTPVVSGKYMDNGSGMRGKVEFDPFPSTELLSKDPWAQPKTNQEADPFTTGRLQKEHKVEDWLMNPANHDDIFSHEKQPDAFAESDQVSPVFQRRNSQRQKQSLPSTTYTEDNTYTSRKEPGLKEETTVTTAPEVLSARGARNRAIAATPSADERTENDFNGSKDPFGAEPFSSTLTSSEPLNVVLEEVEPASPSEGLSGGKAPLRAWVSPSDVQPVSAQSSNGGGLALTQRRPHPVKPMSSESQHPISTAAVKETKVRESTPRKVQVANGSVDSGPFSQLTQEELITLVVRQQADLSKKDSKIVELEEYIDNLLVRVIDEQPAILQSLNSGKPV
uniref:RAB11 family interacting protein 1 (class I) a n=1 Tax=Gasterosteus aculeatus aculeatus TaxID=481459 RepID=G3PAI3_GASAC